jgi:hypothetical protein
MKDYALFFGRWAVLCINQHTKSLFITITFLILFSNISKAQVSGRVFKDFNVNGTWDSTATFLDQGRAGVRVEVFDNNGISKGFALTALSGKYLIPGVSGNLRVHFTMPTYYTDGFITSVNSNNQSNIQFVNAPASNVDLGLNFADDYCGEDPSVVVPCYVVGIGNTLTPNDGLALFKYSASGTDHSQIQMPNGWFNVGRGLSKRNKFFFYGSFYETSCQFWHWWNRSNLPNK